MYYFPFYYDPYFFLILIGLAITGWASFNVNSTFARFDRVQSKKRITAREAAEYILQSAGITNVTVNEISGHLTDNYNGRDKTLNLSDSTANSTSVAAIGVAAHEVGHAIQDATNYKPMRVRSGLVPIVNIGSSVSMPLILIGVVLGMNRYFIYAGIWAFAAVVLFQVVTLPVEFNASNRAVQILANSPLLEADEIPAVKKVLKAAALTYVAAVLSTLLQLFRLILLFTSRDDN